MKAATWEEELRPQLPRRIDVVGLRLDFEPPVVALVRPPDEPDASLILASTAATPIPAAKAPRSSWASRPAQVAPSKFESVALVMAAILAVLLGLAIGTVLARTGRPTPRPTPASVTQSAAVQTAG